MELRGEAQGVRVYDDFAHHPTAIRETLAGVRAARAASRIWGIFEPRSATSCRRVFQDEFSTAFDSVDEAILAAVFRANLPDDQRLSGEAVVAGINARGTRARLIPTVPEIVTSVAAEARAGDLVVIMSNGGLKASTTSSWRRSARALQGRPVALVRGLVAEFGERVRVGESLAPLTTFQIGGPAALRLDVVSDEELARALAVAHARGVAPTILGGGSNVLVGDDGVTGLVLRVRTHRIDDEGEGRVRVSAGVTINGLVRWLVGRGYRGLEAWAGTPGTGGVRSRQRALPWCADRRPDQQRARADATRAVRRRRATT
jgi:hypothetical protein